MRASLSESWVSVQVHHLQSVHCAHLLWQISKHIGLVCPGTCSNSSREDGGRGREKSWRDKSIVSTRYCVSNTGGYCATERSLLRHCSGREDRQWERERDTEDTGKVTAPTAPAADNRSGHRTGTDDTWKERRLREWEKGQAVPRS